MKKFLFFLLIVSNIALYADYQESQEYKDIYAVVEKALYDAGKGYIKDKTVNKIINQGIAKSIYVIQDVLTSKLSLQTIQKLSPALSEGFNTSEHFLKAFEKKGFSKITDISLLPSKTDMLLLPVDVAVAFCKIYFTKDVSNQYRKPIQWWIDLAYTDLKAAAMYTAGDKLSASSEFIVGNSYVLVDMGKSNYDAMKDYKEAKTDLDYSLQLGKAMDLQWKYESAYFKSETAIDKLKFLNWFLEDYDTQIIKPFKDKWFKNYDLIEKLRGDKWWRYDHIKEKDANKHVMLYKQISSQTKEDYLKFIKYYFPNNEYEKLSKLYDVYNFSPNLGAKSNDIAFKYLKKIYAHGIRRSNYENTTFDDEALVSLYDAIYFIYAASSQSSNALHLHFKTKAIISKDFPNMSSSDKVNRQFVAKLLIDYFELEKRLSATKKYYLKQKVQYSTLHDSYESLLLKELDIVTDNRDFLPSSQINNITILMWVSNTLDYMACGQTSECTYEKIIEGNLL